MVDEDKDRLDLFAALAMHALINNRGATIAKDVAEWAYLYAKAMLEERKNHV